MDSVTQPRRRTGASGERENKRVTSRTVTLVAPLENFVTLLGSGAQPPTSPGRGGDGEQRQRGRPGLKDNAHARPDDVSGHNSDSGNESDDRSVAGPHSQDDSDGGIDGKPATDAEERPKQCRYVNWGDRCERNAATNQDFCVRHLRDDREGPPRGPPSGPAAAAGKPSSRLAAVQASAAISRTSQNTLADSEGQESEEDDCSEDASPPDGDESEVDDSSDGDESPSDNEERSGRKGSVTGRS